MILSAHGVVAVYTRPPGDLTQARVPVLLWQERETFSRVVGLVSTPEGLLPADTAFDPAQFIFQGYEMPAWREQTSSAPWLGPLGSGTESPRE